MARTAKVAGGASGATAGKHVAGLIERNYAPAHDPLFPLRPRVPEVAPFIHTYGAYTGSDNLSRDILEPPRGAPLGSFYDAGKADHAVAFITRLKHFQGRYAGNPFRLAWWQERLIRYVFGWHRLDDDGHPIRLIRQVYLEVPRKNGKSTFAAAIALYLAYEDSEPAPQVFFAAADKDQASIAYGMARVLVEQDKDLAGRSVIYNSTRKILVPGSHGELRALSSKTAGVYGLNLHGLVFDELMAQPDRVLWDALTTAQGSRAQPLIFAISTAGWDRQSIAFEQREYARQIASGSLTDPTFLGVCYTVAEDADWTLPETWQAAAPSLGETVELSYYERKASEAVGQPSAQNSFRTLMLCQWVGQSKRVIPMPDWDFCDGIELPRLAGARCFGGLDLSKTTDMTALVLDFPLANNKHAWLARIWVPADDLRDRGLRDRAPYQEWVDAGYLHTSPGAVIDFDATVKPTLREWAESYDIRDVSYDRWGATQLADELEADGFTMVKIGQGFATMSPPTKELVRLVVGHNLALGGNPVLKWMADNAGGETDAAENLKLSKTRSATRIDGLVAGIMALDGAMRRGRKRVSIYEERGPDDMFSTSGGVE